MNDYLNNVKKAGLVLATATVLVAGAPAVTAGDSPHEFSANVALTTDYLFRGISQTNSNPAIQGGFDYSYTPFGFYAGVWASNLEFNSGSGDEASIEIDYYGGFAGEFANGITWDIGGLYYHYPSTNDDDAGNPDLDYVEAYANLGYTFSDIQFEPAVGVGVAYSPDFFGEDDDGVYVNGTLGLSLPYGIGLDFLVGYQDVEGDKLTPGGFDYVHYSIGLNKDILGPINASLSWNDAGDEDDCGGSICDDIILFTLSSSF
ncbi:MAG TPA: TorF family putative porin [Gammaproteobacteria bacterium]|nr:TorF family putative porin [Gammaproteobacteria bacterium]